LNIGLTYDEIDDLMKIADVDHSGSIKYDEFLSIMEVHIKRKKNQAEESAKEIIFHKLKSLLDNNKDSLIEIMFNYDLDNSGFIHTEDLSRVFKKIGILHPEPHMDTLKAAGGVLEGHDKIDYQIFSDKLYTQIQKTLGLNIKKSHELVQKISAVIQAKKASVFDLYCILDINMSGSVSKLEFRTGI
jgi:Ca2+-binding EF-hand superfamily protein